MSPNGPNPPPKPSNPPRRCAVDAGVAEHVVRAAALSVREHPVRLVELLEALLGAVAVVDVGMMLLRQLAGRRA